MKKTGIFYGSSSGNTKGVAEKIAKALGIDRADVHDVAKAKAGDLAGYELLLLGCSTWGLGDLQDDFADFVGELSKADLSGKKVGLFGCGDSSSYPDTFCNALGTIYKAVCGKAEMIGNVSVEGYTYDDSEAVVEGHFVGLPLDEDNESKLTGKRIEDWLQVIKAEM
ncbi:MAG: flavodoxin [Tannerellaceae bacterium]|jgi:flavodoxin I|nr:flavodoxin [Tannerellaceae bacterium]